MGKVHLSWRSWLIYAAKSPTKDETQVCAKYLLECTTVSSANPNYTRGKLYALARREFLMPERLSRMLDMVDKLEETWRKHGGIGFIDCDGPGWKPLPCGGHQKIDFHDQTS